MISIKEIANKTDWNNFLLRVNPNTFLQSWEWGQVQLQDEEQVRYLGIFDDSNTPIGAGLLITVNARRGRFLLCPHGPITPPSIGGAGGGSSLENIMKTFITHAQTIAKQDKAVALKIAPLIESTSENKQLFKDLGFRPAPLHIHTEETWMLDITPSEEDLLQNMRKTTRHAIRKAEREGVAVEITTDPAVLERFWPLYEKTKSRHDFTPFPRSFLDKQFQEFSTDNQVYMAIASHKSKDVVAGMFIHFGNTVFYHHGASVPLPSKIPAAQLLQWASIQEAKKRGAERYNFWGIAPEDQPNHPFAGITTFKKGFGGYAINYLHAQDLPLSLHYWKLWLVDTIRKKQRGF